MIYRVGFSRVNKTNSQEELCHIGPSFQYSLEFKINKSYSQMNQCKMQSNSSKFKWFQDIEIVLSVCNWFIDLQTIIKLYLHTCFIGAFIKIHSGFILTLPKKIHWGTKMKLNFYWQQTWAHFLCIDECLHV